MHLEPESDLHWTAFLYVSGELAPFEASSFEDRLADDPLARDAVIRAVELAGVVALVAPEFRPGRRRIGRRTLASAVALAAAACLVLAISHRLRPAPPVGFDAPTVAMAWSSLRDDAEATSPTSTTAESEADPVDEIEVDREPPAGRPLPSWLLSAASTPVGDAPREED